MINLNEKIVAVVRVRSGKRIVVAGSIQVRCGVELENACAQLVFDESRRCIYRAGGSDVCSTRHSHHAGREYKFALTFITAEEECSVLDDGATKNAAEVIVSKFILL